MDGLGGRESLVCYYTEGYRVWVGWVQHSSSSLRRRGRGQVVLFLVDGRLPWTGQKQKYIRRLERTPKIVQYNAELSSISTPILNNGPLVIRINSTNRKSAGELRSKKSKRASWLVSSIDMAGT